MPGDRRREPRRAASGHVRLYPESPMAAGLAASLVDVSPYGFRARHGEPTLVTGVLVSFEHPFAAGRAKVMWTRIAGEQIESGFLVL